MLRKCIVRRSPESISVILPEKEQDNFKIFYCLDIRGVIVWPEIDVPGYIAIYALKNQMGTTGKFNVRLIDEFEDVNPTKLLKAMFSMSRMYKASIFYADMGQKRNIDFVQMFNDFSRFQRDGNIALQPAPFVRQFDSGMAILNEYIDLGALELSGLSLIYKQLDEVNSKGLTNSEIDKIFNAIHGLVYILGSVEKDPWNVKRIIPERLTRGHNFGAWT